MKKAVKKTKAAGAAQAGRKGSPKKGRLYAAILAGGVGSRFWPLSRETTPKQLLRVVGEDSLLKTTIRRLSPLVPEKRVSIVTNSRQAELIRQHLSYEGRPFSPEYIIEPLGRNTAPAIGLAAMRLYEKDPDALMTVLPADHIIEDVRAFQTALKAAAEAAASNHLVTFGIVPAHPETGYGYIKAGPRAIRKSEGLRVLRVEKFVEKPDLKKAKRYLKEGGYYWNSGIFVWKAARILEEIRAHLPDLYAALQSMSTEGADADEAYGRIAPVSIDQGIMEKADDVVVIPVDFGWSDIGSWSSLADILSKDGSGNIIRGRAVDIGSTGSVIFGSDRVVATIGLRDMILVDTPDATLVCPKDRAQEVKDLVGELKKKGYAELETHRTVERPWGSYTVLETGPGYKIKKICVRPGRRLSLQMHNRRSEHWVVTNGVARVQRGEEVIDIASNQSTYIPRGVKHRLENPGKTPLEIIEVQNGEYVEEDDIVRFDDDFERAR